MLYFLLVSLFSGCFSWMFNHVFVMLFGVIPLCLGPYMSNWVVVDFVGELFIILSFAVFGGVLLLMSQGVLEKLLFVGCLLCFSLNSVVFFIVVFEFILLPISCKIWAGKSGERFSASMFLLIYTVIFSFPLFCWVLFMGWLGGLGSMVISSFKIEISLFCILVFVVFCVKFPVFVFHVWLPKAHVEAPTVGSIILAACLLKLGSYGLIRFVSLFCTPAQVFYFFSVGVVGGILASLCCIIQWDLKSLIAFSSISHMTFLLCGVFSNSGLSVDSFLFISFSHGIGSSLLFFLFGFIYDSMGSRSVLICRGSTYFSSFLEMLICFICFFNVGFPFLVSFFGEVFLVSSFAVFGGVLSMVCLFFIMFFNSIYVYFLNFSLEGEKFFNKFSFFISEVEVFLILAVFWLSWGLLFVMFFQYGS